MTTKLATMPYSGSAASNPPIPAPYDDAARRAEALADIQKMHDNYSAALAEIGQLKADLNRERDRVDMVLEERNKYRHESMMFRQLLVELATQMTNIGLMTSKAQEIVRTVHEISRSDAPSDEALEQMDRAGK